MSNYFQYIVIFQTISSLFAMQEKNTFKISTKSGGSEDKRLHLLIQPKKLAYNSITVNRLLWNAAK